MSDLRIDTRGFRELRRALERVAGDLTAEATPELARALVPLADAARAEAPVRTGQARAGIAVRALEPTADTAAALVSELAEHGVHRDLGTHAQKADPFLQRAYDVAGDATLDRAAAAVGHLIDRLS